MSAASIKARLVEASTQATVARQALARGRAFDLGGLTEMVEGACRDLADLERPDAKPLHKQLLAPSDELNGLAPLLTREHAALKQALGDLGARERAQSAYAKTARDDR